MCTVCVHGVRLVCAWYVDLVCAQGLCMLCAQGVFMLCVQGVCMVCGPSDHARYNETKDHTKNHHTIHDNLLTTVDNE